MNVNPLKFGALLLGAVTLAGLTASGLCIPDGDVMGCNTWRADTTVDMYADSSTVYDTEQEAAAAPAMSYSEVCAAQAPVFSGPFTCDKICPPNEYPGCQKTNKFTGGNGPSVTGVPAPGGGFSSRTSYTGVTRQEGCRVCIKIETGQN
jgi:hypothetical protein